MSWTMRGPSMDGVTPTHPTPLLWGGFTLDVVSG